MTDFEKEMKRLLEQEEQMAQVNRELDIHSKRLKQFREARKVLADKFISEYELIDADTTRILPEGKDKPELFPSIPETTSRQASTLERVFGVFSMGQTAHAMDQILKLKDQGASTAEAILRGGIPTQAMSSWDAFQKIFTGESNLKELSYSDILAERTGKNNLATKIGGFGLDIATDPTFFMNAPGQIFKGIASLGKEAEAIARSVPAIDKTFDSIGRAFDIFHDVKKLPDAFTYEKSAKMQWSEPFPGGNAWSPVREIESVKKGFIDFFRSNFSTKELIEKVQEIGSYVDRPKFDPFTRGELSSAGKTLKYFERQADMGTSALNGPDMLAKAMSEAIGATTAKGWGSITEAIKLFDTASGALTKKLTTARSALADLAGSEGTKGTLLEKQQADVVSRLEGFLPNVDTTKETIERAIASMIESGKSIPDEIMKRFKYLTPTEPALDGIKLVAPKSPSLGKDVRLPESIAKIVDDYLLPGGASQRQLTSPFDWFKSDKLANVKNWREEFLGAYDDILGFFRAATTMTSPAWYSRNAIGGAVQNWFQGTKVADFVDSLKVITGKFTGTIQGMPQDQILATSQRQGIWGQSGMSEFAQRFVNNPLSQLVEKLEGMIRMPGFVHELKEGKSASEAAQRVSDFQGEYTAKLKTSFEKDVVGRILFFPSWQKFMVKFFGDAEKWAASSKPIMIIDKMMDNIKEAGEYIPEYVRDKLRVGGLSFFGTPLEDAVSAFKEPLKYLEQTIAAPLRSMAEMLAPVITKDGIKVGYNTFKEKAIEDDVSGKQWKYMPALIKALVGFDEATGKISNPRVAHAIESIGSRPLSETRMAADEDKSSLSRFMRWLIPVRPYGVTPEQQKVFESIEAKKLVVKEGAFTPDQKEEIGKTIPMAPNVLGTYGTSPHLYLEEGPIKKAFMEAYDAALKKNKIPTDYRDQAPFLPDREDQFRQKVTRKGFEQEKLQLEVDRRDQPITEAILAEKKKQLVINKELTAETGNELKGKKVAAQIEEQIVKEKAYSTGQPLPGSPEGTPPFKYQKWGTKEVLRQPIPITDEREKEFTAKLQDRLSQLLSTIYNNVGQAMESGIGKIQFITESELNKIAAAERSWPGYDTGGVFKKARQNVAKAYAIMMEQYGHKMAYDAATLEIGRLEKLPDSYRRAVRIYEKEQEQLRESAPYRRAVEAKDTGWIERAEGAFRETGMTRMEGARVDELTREAALRKEIYETILKTNMAIRENALDTNKLNISEWSTQSRADIEQYTGTAISEYQKILDSMTRQDPDTGLFYIPPDMEERALNLQKIIENLRQGGISSALSIDQKTITQLNTARNTLLDIQKFLASTLTAQVGPGDSKIWEAQLDQMNQTTYMKYEEQINRVSDMKTASLEDDWNKAELIASLRSAREAEIVANGEKLKQEKWKQSFDMFANMAGTGAQVFSMIYEVTGKKHKELMYAFKAMAVAEATMKGATAAINAYNAGASAPPPMGGPYLGAAYAAMAIAFTSAQIAKIMSTPMALGGPIEGGSGTRDDVPILAMGGEYMMSKPAVAHYGREFMTAVNRMTLDASDFVVPPSLDTSVPRVGYATGGPVVLPSSRTPDAGTNITIINATDRRMLLEALATPEGQDAVINIMAGRADDVRRISR